MSRSFGGRRPAGTGGGSKSSGSDSDTAASSRSKWGDKNKPRPRPKTQPEAKAVDWSRLGDRYPNPRSLAKRLSELATTIGRLTYELDRRKEELDALKDLKKSYTGERTTKSGKRQREEAGLPDGERTAKRQRVDSDDGDVDSD